MTTQVASQITTISAAETRRRKSAIESKLKELLGSSPEREELQTEHLSDPLDQIKSNVDRELVIERLNRQTHLVRDLHTALARIEGGDYGLCEQCEEAIPRKRLDAVPWARLCVACQSQAEAAGQVGNVIFEDAA